MKTAGGDNGIRQLTVRLPSDLYERARLAARSRRTSVSSLVRQLLEDLDRSERERALERAFDLLGQDSERNVERFFEAQAEVARRG